MTDEAVEAMGFEWADDAPPDDGYVDPIDLEPEPGRDGWPVRDDDLLEGER